MNIIIWLLFGALVGWIASKLMGTDSQQGVLANIIVGIVGAFLGGYIMQIIGKSGVDGFNIRSFIVALIGSIILLFIYKMVRRRA